jgi:hypothetical protein
MPVTIFLPHSIRDDATVAALPLTFSIRFDTLRAGSVSALTRAARPLEILVAADE